MSTQTVDAREVMGNFSNPPPAPRYVYNRLYINISRFFKKYILGHTIPGQKINNKEMEIILLMIQ